MFTWIFFEFIDTHVSYYYTYINGVEGLPYGCLSFSAGIAECEKETYSISELLSKADQALYAAKKSGEKLGEDL